MKKMNVSIAGMHCRSCELLIEGELAKIPEVRKAEVDYKKGQANIYYSEQVPNGDEVESAIRAAGYTVGEPGKRGWFSRKMSDYEDLGIAVLFVIGAVVVLKTLGISQWKFVSAEDPSSLGVVFLVGVTAGLSTCLALVGGLVLGVSARHAEQHPEATSIQKFRPHLFFNTGRVTGYVLFGGILGVAGSVLNISTSVMGILTIIVGGVMLVLGLKLLGIFPRLAEFNFTMPKNISRFFGLRHRDREYSHKNAFTLGAMTFFLPCGFTQTMQLLAVSTGSFTRGAFIMGVFALGTMPGLLGIGGVASVVKGVFARRFFTFAGVVVIFLAFFNISNGYTLTGWKVNSESGATSVVQEKIPRPATQLPSGGNQKPTASNGTGSDQAPVNGPIQTMNTVYTLNADIQPNTFTVKAGQLVRFTVDVRENGSGCMSTIMIPGLYESPQFLQKGKTLIMEFTPKKKGIYEITCAMGISRGEIIVQ